MDSLIKKAIKHILIVFFSLFRDILPKKNIIIFSGINDITYNGNSRYLFEYLSTKKNYEVYWFTRSDIIKKHLKDNRMQYLSYNNPFKLIYKSFFMKIVFNDGDSYFNLFGLADSKKTYKISLFHGYGPKTTIAALGNSSEIKSRINKINKFNYVNFTSEYSANHLSKDVFYLPDNKVKILGFPKMDLFYDKEYTEKMLINKSKLSELFPSRSKMSKLIVYTPTWRPYDYNLPLLDINNFNTSDFNKYLEEKDIYFIYSVHSANIPKKIIKNMSRILYINEAYPLYDTNEMMLEADILMNDYSNTLVEYSVLARPQIFCIPDYEYYKKTKGFVEDFMNIMPGECFGTFTDLKDTLERICLNTEKYSAKFSDHRLGLLTKYYNLKDKRSVKNYKTLIDKIFNT